MEAQMRLIVRGQEGRLRTRCIVGLLLVLASCRAAPSSAYLFLWAGDADRKASDFLAVLDANPQSERYGTILASVPTGFSGSNPHHTEHEMSPNGHLLANGFDVGRTWLFDVSRPLSPKILTVFADVAGYSHPHTFIRMPNGHILATFQYTGPVPDTRHEMHGEKTGIDAQRFPGGLVEMDEQGHPFRTGSALDSSVQGERTYPYSVVPIPQLDRAVSTTTDMNQANASAGSEWVQIWRLSDLKLLRSIALEKGTRGDENLLTGEPRLLQDGQSVYVHTFNCGLYLLRDLDREEPSVTLVTTFEGKNCGNPIQTGHYWIQAAGQAVISLDIGDPEHPRSVSTVSLGEDEEPHWTSLDSSSRRIVVNSSGTGTGNRLFVINFDPATGALSVDTRFWDPGSERPGVTLSAKTWPHGFTGKIVPHGVVFSR